MSAPATEHAATVRPYRSSEIGIQLIGRRAIHRPIILGRATVNLFFELRRPWWLVAPTSTIIKPFGHCFGEYTAPPATISRTDDLISSIVACRRYGAYLVCSTVQFKSKNRIRSILLARPTGLLDPNLDRVLAGIIKRFHVNVVSDSGCLSYFPPTVHCVSVTGETIYGAPKINQCPMPISFL